VIAMGRTIPSFRLAQAAEELDWRAFRNALDKSDCKKFDRMFASSRLYISACSYAVKPIRIQPIFMSILFHQYKQLTKCIEQIAKIEVEMPA